MLAFVRLTAVLMAALLPGAARAFDPLETERDLADEMTTTASRGWAILPQIGYSPEKSGNLGVKLSIHELAGQQIGLDLNTIYALAGQYHGDLTLMRPELFTKYLLGMVETHFRLDPTKEFFGLGNNDSGPEELSSHEFQSFTLLGTLAVRPIPRVSLAFSGGFRTIDVRHGKLIDPNPSTRKAFPSLIGERGGETSPISFSITFNNRQDPARPTRGWILMVKAQHVPEAFGNDFEFTRLTGDVSYLLPLLTRRQVLGLRLGGEVMEGGKRQIPFYELGALGSSRDLRGYFDDRFLGDALIVTTAEYRLKLFDFDFFDIWHVQIDGVGFGEAGRVFIDENRIDAQSVCPPPGLPLIDPPSECRPLPEDDDDIRVSYGGGTRIALGKALIARIDVGFSEEETGLVYLTFGQTF